MLCLNVAPKPVLAVADGPWPQLALIDKESSYSQWLGRDMEAELLDCAGKVAREKNKRIKQTKPERIILQAWLGSVTLP